MTTFGVGETLAIVQLLELPKILKSFCSFIKRFRHASRDTKKFWRQFLREYRLVETNVYNFINLTKKCESFLRERQQDIQEIAEEAKEVFLALEKKYNWVIRTNWTLRAKWALGKSYCKRAFARLQDLSGELCRHVAAIQLLYDEQKRARQKTNAIIGVGVGLFGGALVGAVIGAKCCSVGGIGGAVVGGLVGGILGGLAGWFWT